MKIINPFTALRNFLTESRRKDAVRETERIVNNKVIVGNDPKDPKNGIYIFCGGIPVLRVANDTCLSNNEVGINNVPEVVKNIKNMYRSYLNRESISKQS